MRNPSVGLNLTLFSLRYFFFGSIRYDSEMAKEKDRLAWCKP